MGASWPAEPQPTRTLPTECELHRGLGRRRAGRIPEALDDHPDADRELPSGDGQGGDEGPCRDLVVVAEEGRDGGGEKERGADETGRGDDAGDQARAVEQCAEEECVEGRHEAGSEQEGRVPYGDEGLAGRDCHRGVGAGRAGVVLAHSDDGEQADDADGDDRGFQHARGDEAKCQGLVAPLEDGEQSDGGADGGQGVDHIQRAAPEHAGVRSGADDVRRVVEDRAEQDQGRDRGGERDQVEHAGDEDVAPGRVGWRAYGGRGSECGRHVRSPSCVVVVSSANRSAGTRVSETRGRPRSRSRCSTPCSAVWSGTGPYRTVVPSSYESVSPSNRAAHRVSRRPSRRISYQPDSRRSSVAWLLMTGTLGTDVVTRHHIMW